MSDIWLLILLGAIATYATRILGYLAIARFGTIPFRVEAALDAVPPAVLVTIAVPMLVDGGWVERVVIVASAFVALRLSVLATTFLGVLALALARLAGA